MRYDFDRVTDRRGTNAVKWNVGENELPMWVADMDFMTAPPILEAVRACAGHGIWGYTALPDAWYDAYIGWWRDRHGLAMEKDWLLFATGIVPAIGSVVRRLTAPGEKVLIQSPVYNCFFSAVTDSGRQVKDCPLAYNERTQSYSIDFHALDEALADPQVTLMLLCNPHNPTGNIWDGRTLAAIGDACARHGVTVLSDEIHCDVTDPGVDYVPFASVSDACRDMSVTCIAPTKAFNLAGLKSAAVAAPNPVLRDRIRAALHTDGVSEVGAFAVDATVAAFTQCGPWLDELRAYVTENKRYVQAFLEKELPQVKAAPSKATYLLWLDCSALSGDKGDLARFIREKTGLFLNAGGMYGDTGRDFLRMNLGCARSLVEDGLKRLKTGVEAWEKVC